MKRRQFDPLVIHSSNNAISPFPKHSHTYYEMFYINEGSGVHIINNNQIAYQSGDLFLISPEDEHYLAIDIHTYYTLIRFTDQFFNSDSLPSPQTHLNLSPEDIMRYKLFKEIKITFDEPCKAVLKSIIQNILSFSEVTGAANSPFLYYQILSIFGLIQQATIRLNPRFDNRSPGKEELISYIHQHIYEPEKIQIKDIAAHFNIAPSYFSSWFKRNFEISYRDYINGYRTKLIEMRVGTNKLTLRQIAAEFGFTDVSHLSNYFKKKTNTNASDYRKQV
ncbi:MAG: transcriptional regulator, AraC family [Mucilaginibacter sp.]|nr:transcriptional regulator, AraC family [Mucilaginibacter sp.]